MLVYGCAGIGLLLLVAALARDAGGAAEGMPGTGPTVDLSPVLTSFALVLMGAVLVAILLVGLRHPRRLALGVVLALLVAGAALWALSTLPAGRDDRPSEVVEPPPPTTVAPVAGGDEWLPTGPLLLVLVAAMAAGGLVIARLARSRAADEAHEGAEDEDEEAALDDEAVGQVLASQLGEVIDELRSDPDPRRAVIRAWARLEALLAAHRMPRSPAELTSSYVERALVRLDASAPAVRALTTTFERAMYSVHPIGRDEQLAAVDALDAVRAELGVPV